MMPDSTKPDFYPEWIIKIPREKTLAILLECINHAFIEHKEDLTSEQAEMIQESLESISLDLDNPDLTKLRVWASTVGNLYVSYGNAYIDARFPHLHSHYPPPYDKLPLPELGRYPFRCNYYFARELPAFLSALIKFFCFIVDIKGYKKIYYIWGNTDQILSLLCDSFRSYNTPFKNQTERQIAEREWQIALINKEVQ